MLYIPGVGLVPPLGDIPLLLCLKDVAPLEHFYRCVLSLIDVDGNVHGEHSERESSTNRSEGTELCEATYEPRETEDNRPCDSDSNYIYDEGQTFRTPVPPRGETCKCKHDGSSNDISCECLHSSMDIYLTIGLTYSPAFFTLADTISTPLLITRPAFGPVK